MRNNQKIWVWFIAGIIIVANLPSMIEQTFAQTTINGAGAIFHFL